MLRLAPIYYETTEKVLLIIYECNLVGCKNNVNVFPTNVMGHIVLFMSITSFSCTSSGKVALKESTRLPNAHSQFGLWRPHEPRG